jgi:DegV family protein with EDD domain
MMAPIRIVTDSTARFPVPGRFDRNSIVIAPMTIRSGAYAYSEIERIEPIVLQQMFSNYASLPIAEPPSQEAFFQLFNSLKPESDQILSIHTSSGINQTVANASAASKHFLGRNDIQIIDTGTFSVGLGLLVQAAAEAAARGEDFESLIRTVRKLIPRIYTVFFVDDLAFLEHNSLISRSQSILGTMLGIITFLTVEHGTIIPMEKVRTRTRAIDKLIEFVTEFSDVDHLSILQNDGRSDEDCRVLVERLKSYYPDTPISVARYGPSVASYVGPNSIGIVVLESEVEA